MSLKKQTVYICKHKVIYYSLLKTILLYLCKKIAIDMLRKLLRQNISKAQFVGFAIANFAGLTIVLLSIQLYLDVRPIFDGKDSIMKKDYFVITKNVSTLNSLVGSSGFSPEEIARLESQSFVGKVGSFTSSQFEVYGGISAAGINFGADLFFEAIPTEFIDIRSDKWHFDPQKRFVPIIVPQNYLDLYNFGFATSRKMPSISGGTVQMVRFDLNIAGNGTVEKFEGGIVGFSNRINTILVPQEFMTWANNRFAPDKRMLPARLIVEISNITDPAIATFFRDNGYKIEGENQSVGRMAYFLRVAFVVCLLIGIVIFALSFAILVLSIYLILQKNREKIGNLRLAGYPRRAVVGFYFSLTSIVNTTVTLLSVLTVFALRPLYMSRIVRVLDSEPTVGVAAVVIATALALLAAISLLNLLIVTRKVE